MKRQQSSRPSPVRQRVYRGVEGILAPWRRVDDAPAVATLSPAGLALFRRMSTADRAHSLRVYAQLRQRGCEREEVLAAALLHDCGKAAARLAVWQRTLKVALKMLAPGLWRRLSAPVSPDSWRYPLHVLAEHPRLGADWAQEAGCTELTCWLIRHHESDIAPRHPWALWLQRLQDADALS